jgi:SPP1 gp7 family putative phage head morphogenesis protein
MPVHKVKGGYRWGTHGHVYKSKKGAQRQAAAIYASGWRDDRKTARLLKASPKAETAYVIALAQIMEGIHRGVLKHLDTDGFREDAKKKVGLTGRLLALIMIWATPKIERAYSIMSKDVRIRVAENLTLIGIDPRHTAGVEAYIAIARKENVLLIRNAAEDFLASVQKVLDENEGAHPNTVANLLQDRVVASKYRARLIARDQTLKLSAAITEFRMRAAGVSRYRWSTSQDERVRTMHAELHGQEFSFDDPPVTNPQGESNNPGGDYQCRCVATPLLPDE